MEHTGKLMSIKDKCLEIPGLGQTEKLLSIFADIENGKYARDEFYSFHVKGIMKLACYKKLIILLLMVACRFGLAQEYVKGENGNDSFPKINRPAYIIKVAPLALIGPYEGTSLRIGMEYPIKARWSGYTELIHYFYNTGDGIKMEFKHYLPGFSQEDKHSSSRDYVSIELFYKRQCYSTYDSIFMPNERYRKNYNVNKSVECLTAKYGIQNVYRCGITIDFFMGLGIRVKQARNTLTKAENDNIEHWGDYGTNRIVNRAGNFVYPNFDIGLKIGFGFKNRS
jgi:hypothetical protein